MKMKKLSEEHYIICDDSEIKTGDWYYDSNDVESLIPIYQRSQQFADYSGCKKITHSTQPLGFLNEVGLTTANLKPDWTNVEYLPLSEVKELLGVADVEKSMWYERNLQNPYPLDSPSNTGFKKGFELGYNQALEDNKEKKYKEEDMRKAIEIAQTTSYVSTQLFSDQSSVKHNFSAEEIIQSLQPKTEWEVEFVDGKLKLKQ